MSNNKKEKLSSGYAYQSVKSLINRIVDFISYELLFPTNHLSNYVTIKRVDAKRHQLLAFETLYFDLDRFSTRNTKKLLKTHFVI